MLPPILYFIAILFLTCALVSAAVVAVDLAAHPQKIRIMNGVWPVTMLYLGPLGLIFYYLYGRNKVSIGRWFRRQNIPFWAQVMKSAMRSAVGCALGYFVAEAVAYVYGLDLPITGMLALVLAFAFGLFVHYAAIAATRRKNIRKNFIAAIRSAALPLSACQTGMLAWMILAQKTLYPDIDPASWDYWYMAQVAVTIGLAFSYPVHWLLLRHHIKDAV